jgi:hypothetical protein
MQQLIAVTTDCWSLGLELLELGDNPKRLFGKSFLLYLCGTFGKKEIGTFSRTAGLV